MEYYDAHIHFFYQCSFNELKLIFNHLEKAGFAGRNTLVISEFPAEIDAYLKMIPGAYHPFVTRGNLVEIWGQVLQ